jgi:hypothetical protein
MLFVLKKNVTRGIESYSSAMQRRGRDNFHVYNNYTMVAVQPKTPFANTRNMGKKVVQTLISAVVVHIVTDPRKSGPLPLNGQLVTDVISAVTDTDSYPTTRNG